MSRLSILFFGMQGIFSRAPLAALLGAGHDVRAVVVPRRHALPGSSLAPRLLIPPRQHGLTLQLVGQPTEPTILGVAWAAGIPVLEIARPTRADAYTALTAYAADVLCVACFPYLLPRRLLALARHGGFNVHPSLLPAYRGSSPLFWVYHDGLEHAGVTIHQLDEGADTGDIAAQQQVEIADGIRYSDAERSLSGVGGQLLVGVLHDIANGRLRLQPQAIADAPKAPTPADADYIIHTDWPARRAFNFIRGLAEWGHPFTIVTRDGPLVVRDAVDFDATRPLSAPPADDGSRLLVRFSPGVVAFERDAVEHYPP